MEQKDISTLSIEELKILHFDVYQKCAELNSALLVEKQNLLTIEALIKEKISIPECKDAEVPTSSEQ